LHPFLDNQISMRTKKPFSLGFQSNHSNCKQSYPLRDLNPCSCHEKMMSYTPRWKGQNFKEKCPARAALQEKEVAQSAAYGSFMRHFSFSSTIIYNASNQKKKSTLHRERPLITSASPFYP
jgi:hypothetical protein